MLVSGCISDGCMRCQHIFGECNHNRAGASVDRAVESLTDQFRNAGGIIDLHHPFGHLTEHTAIINFLKCFAFHLIACDLSDEQKHRRGILKSCMNADGSIRRAGATCDKADAGFAGQLAIGIGHIGCSAFLSTDN